MPQQPDSATPTRLCKINASRIGHKIRVAGRVLSYDAESGHIVLLDGDCAVLVDASLCLNVRSSTWVRERLSKIIAICYVEGSPVRLSCGRGTL
ncbi:hypothetical protein BDQ12DRAFT_673649 [Crucibulum laeve]|uniref:Replication factor A protein 3 n=1 Tax=Crucibulum laeve TaxID=68775 RepID=A0A5C3MI32_9AGAR|nr:hypothetical protein BDQ12DRAFT_673649 [Crucibulum laeve]